MLWLTINAILIQRELPWQQHPSTFFLKHIPCLGTRSLLIQARQERHYLRYLLLNSQLLSIESGIHQATRNPGWQPIHFTSAWHSLKEKRAQSRNSRVRKSQQVGLNSNKSSKKGDSLEYYMRRSVRKVLFFRNGSRQPSKGRGRYKEFVFWFWHWMVE